MDSRKQRIALNYGSSVPPRFPWRLVVATLVVIVYVPARGFHGAPMDISSAKQPFDGQFVYRGARGQVLQEMTFRNGRLISAWEMVEHSDWVNAVLIIDPPKWEQVVKDGNG